jgi:hypothetical protein
MDKIEDLKAEQILKEVGPWVNEEVTFMDALVHYAQKYDIEVELIGDIVKRSPILKAKIREDAERLRLMEKTARLPV